MHKPYEEIGEKKPMWLEQRRAVQAARG
jgi:hypothetical protein